jgi:hypothetical protein
VLEAVRHLEKPVKLSSGKVRVGAMPDGNARIRQHARTAGNVFPVLHGVEHRFCAETVRASAERAGSPCPVPSSSRSEGL